MKLKSTYLGLSFASMFFLLVLKYMIFLNVMQNLFGNVVVFELYNGKIRGGPYHVARFGVRDIFEFLSFLFGTGTCSPIFKFDLPYVLLVPFLVSEQQFQVFRGYLVPIPLLLPSWYPDNLIQVADEFEPNVPDVGSLLHLLDRTKSFGTFSTLLGISLILLFASQWW